MWNPLREACQYTALCIHQCVKFHITVCFKSSYLQTNVLPSSVYWLLFEDFRMSAYNQQNQTFSWEIKVFFLCLFLVGMWLSGQGFGVILSSGSFKIELRYYVSNLCKVFSLRVCEAALPLDLSPRSPLTPLRSILCALRLERQPGHGTLQPSPQGARGQTCRKKYLAGLGPSPQNWGGDVKPESREPGEEGIQTAGYFWVKWTGKSFCFCNSWQSRSSLAEKPQSRSWDCRWRQSSGRTLAFCKDVRIERGVKGIILQRDLSAPTLTGLPCALTLK